MTDISVIVCAGHLHAHYLDRALESLRKQSLIKTQWELLVIEIALESTRGSPPNISWHPNSRHVVEGGPNHASAFKQCIREASGRLIVFMDDKSALDSNYLSDAIRIGHEWPRLGIWGSGSINLEFGNNPSERVKDLASIIARCNVESLRYSNVFTCVEAAPLGAGVCVREDIVSAYCKRPSRLVADHFDCEEDFLLDFAADEMDYLACRSGSGMAIFPQLKLTRLIPEAQATKRYFIFFRERQMILRGLLNFEWKGLKPIDPLSAIGILSTLKYILLERGVRRQLSIADLRAALKLRRILDEI